MAYDGLRSRRLTGGKRIPVDASHRASYHPSEPHGGDVMDRLWLCDVRGTVLYLTALPEYQRVDPSLPALRLNTIARLPVSSEDVILAQ